MRLSEIIEKYHYPTEIHNVITDDGYILTLHRVPNIKEKNTKVPVLLVHGLAESAHAWTILGPQKALVYILSDAGYDVWMANVRGSLYSRNHTKLDPDQKEFWDYSFHEIGILDLPATIDYILFKTGAVELSYVGHSQGNTAFFIMCSERPSYNDKIRLQISLAPVVTWKPPIQHALFRTMATFTETIGAIAELQETHEIPTPNKHLRELCFSMPRLCKLFMSLIFGSNPKETDENLLPLIAAHALGGCSIKQVKHYGQQIASGSFSKFDYGPIKNFIKYGTLNPPLYNLGKVTSPIYLIYGANDWMTSERNVRELVLRLPNLKDVIRVEDPNWTHVDFLYGIDAPKLVYSKILKILNETY